MPRLTSAIAAGDSDAFGRFYDAWFDRAFAMARSLSKRDESFCLDIVQDVMMRVVRHMRRLPDERALASWMARAVMTAVIDQLRTDGRRSARERASAERRVGREPEPAGGEQLAWLREQLDELPPADRRLLTERFDLGRTLREAGAALGISPFAAHGRIRRTLDRLRRLARERFS